MDGDDLYRDVLFHDQDLDANLIAGTYLDRMPRSREAPMYHYLTRYDGPLGPTFDRRSRRSGARIGI